MKPVHEFKAGVVRPLLILFLFIIFLTSTVSATNSTCQLLTENFDAATIGGLPSTFSNNSVGSTLGLVSNQTALSGSQSLLMDDTGGNELVIDVNMSQVNLSNTDNYNISFYIYAHDNSTGGIRYPLYRFYLINTSGNDATTFLSLTIRDDDGAHTHLLMCDNTVDCVGGGFNWTKQLSKSNFHKITLQVNTTPNSSYAVYVNDTLVSGNARAFMDETYNGSKPREINLRSFGAGSFGTEYIDDFCVNGVATAPPVPIGDAGTETSLGEYTRIANGSHSYELSGSGTFHAPNQATSGLVSMTTKLLEQPKYTPLVADLDNDTDNEIILFDGTELKIYQNDTLTFINSVSVGINASHTEYGGVSNFVIQDIDRDGLKDIVYAVPNGGYVSVYRAEYDGATFTATNVCNHTVANESYNIMINCNNDNRCLAASVDGKDRGKGGMIMTGFGFNHTSCGTIAALDIHIDDSMFCLPDIKNIAVSDNDNDGDEDFILSWLTVDSAGEYNLSVLYVGISTTNVNILTVGDEIRRHFSDTISSAATDNCSSIEAGDHISSPVVFDIDGGGLGTGRHAVLGVATSIGTPNSYKMYAYDFNGNEVDDYPELSEVDGDSISNVVKVDLSGFGDFCAVIPDSADNEINLLCGSENSGGGMYGVAESVTFEIDISGTHNLTPNATQIHNIIHKTDQYSGTIGGVNPDEIVTSWGILGRDSDTRVNITFANPQEDAVLLALDIMQVGQTDLLALTSTNIWYIDDQFTDDGCSNNDNCITEIYYDPCPEVAWLQGTGVEVRVTAEDDIGGNVRAKAILYAGHTNENDSGYSGYSASGSTFVFTFIANETVTNGDLEVHVSDQTNPTDIENITVSFSVAASGIEQGDVDCTDEFVINETVGSSAGSVETTTNNSIYSALEGLSEEANIGMSLLWVFGMIVVAFGVLKLTDNHSGFAMKVGVIAIFEILMVIIGVSIGVLSSSVLIVMTVLGIAAILMFLRPVFTGTGGGG